MSALLLGPLLRYVGEEDATVWVETDGPCEVSVLGCSAPTFSVAGHHYALIHCHNLEPGSTVEYQVALDGKVVWPGDDLGAFPAPTIRTRGGGAPLRVAFGSCRVAVPHVPPHSLTKDEDDRGREIDALYALALQMRDEPHEDWPNLLLWIGDQVYADEISPGVKRFIATRPASERRGTPHDQCADFEEYTRLYWDAWSDHAIRWLLSTVPSAMVFDDHDVHDDWNTSGAWVEQIRQEPWWHERIIGGYMSYWLYQHIGNLAPSELDGDKLFCAMREGGDHTEELRAFAEQAEREVAGTRWSYCRDIGRTRLIVMDSRAGRVIDDDKHRRMVDDEEWAWIVEHATGDFDHLLLGTSLPFLLTPALHYMEAWNEAVVAGAYGESKRVTELAEKLRQAVDLEHWAAFSESFHRVVGLLTEVASGRRGPPPATIVLLSGDVHHAYLAEVAFKRSAGAQSAVYQAVCSPYRNPLDGGERRAIRAAFSRPAHAVARGLAKTAGVPDPEIRWRLVGDGPVFANQVATLELEGRTADLRIERTHANDGDHPLLHESFAAKLA